MKRPSLLKNHSFQESLIFLLIGGLLTWYSLDGYQSSFNKKWAESPYLFPLIIAGLILLLAMIMLVQGIKNNAALPADQTAAEPDQTEKKKNAQSRVRILVVFAICLLYYLALSYIKLPYIGTKLFGIYFRFSTFELTTPFFILALMLFLKVRSKAVLIAVPICSMVVLSFLFRSLLYVNLP